MPLVSAGNEEADERWRGVLFELVKRANADEHFRARVEATGAVIRDFDGVLGKGMPSEYASPGGTIACHEYWWGFQLEIPHAALVGWNASAAAPDEVTASIGIGTGPSSQFRKRVSAWIGRRLEELLELDRGEGIYVSMTWMAPGIFVPTSIIPR